MKRFLDLSSCAILKAKPAGTPPQVQWLEYLHNPTISCLCVFYVVYLHLLSQSGLDLNPLTIARDNFYRVHQTPKT